MSSCCRSRSRRLFGWRECDRQIRSRKLASRGDRWFKSGFLRRRCVANPVGNPALDPSLSAITCGGARPPMQPKKLQAVRPVDPEFGSPVMDELGSLPYCQVNSMLHRRDIGGRHLASGRLKASGKSIFLPIRRSRWRSARTAETIRGGGNRQWTWHRCRQREWARRPELRRRCA